MDVKDYHSICQRLMEHETEHADRVYLRQPREGVYHELTWSMVMHQARQVAFFLQRLKLKKGAHISIYSKNCAEWFIADFGITLAGMVNVPLFPNQHKDSIEYVLTHAEVQLVFVGKLDKYKEAFEAISGDLITVGFDYHPDLNLNHTWSEVLSGQRLDTIASPLPEEVYTIIYSSGTSGAPKGALYTHQAISNYLSILPKDIRRLADLDFYHLLSYLPLAHVYERSAIQLASIVVPADVSFVESLDTFADNLKSVKPTLFAAVPRIWGVFKHKIEQSMPPALLNYLLYVPILAGFVKRKIKHQLGLERSAGNISGASHLPPDISTFFDKLGIPVQEGYGQTENFAYATLSLLNERKSGYVGTPRLEVEIKLGEAQELLMKSPCLMHGYYKDTEATNQAFTKDGWLRTGDIVNIDRKNRIKILGRLSEHFKNQKGEFIAPTPIEKQWSSSRLLDHVCLVGRGLESNVLLVTLSDSGCRTLQEAVNKHLQARLHRVNGRLKSYEKISHIIIVRDAWTTDNDCLTPTLKVKRRVVEERYQPLIQKTMAQSDNIVWE